MPKVLFEKVLVPKISKNEAVHVETIRSNEEVRVVVWSCKSTSVPGPDGYNVGFIKKTWNTIRVEFTNIMKEFFPEGNMAMDINTTWVGLATKPGGSKEMKDLQPISMVGSIYKVIFKVMVARLRPLMVAWLKKTKGKGVVVKLDFQKAYDLVKWSFVQHVLKRMEFGQTWRAWIRAMLETASMSVLVDGVPTKTF
nr:uncharacterized protein LOC112805706 [Arachis hypogaea]